MSTRKKIIIAAVNVLLLALIAVCASRCGSISRALLSQQAAERWAGERQERFAQVSSFYPQGSEKTEADIRSFRETIDKKLADAGAEDLAQGSYWTDAYAAISTASAAGERGSSTATAIGIGGDFFLFHPYTLLSGGYISDDDIMKDRVVIDRELAWKLYGGTQLEGMTMMVNGRQCYIAGVVAREDDKYSQRCYSDKPLIFMHCSELAAEDKDAIISEYEIAMLDPITGYAKQVVKEGLSTSEDAIIIENSSRYEFSAIFDIFKSFGTRAVRSSAVVFPYWENAAKITEAYIARLYVIIALLALFPFICFMVLLIKLIILLAAKLKILKSKGKYIWEHRYDIREERREKREAKKAAEAAEGKPPKKKHFRIKNKQIRVKNEKTPAKKKRNKKEAPKPETAADDELLPSIESIVQEVLQDERTSK